MHAMAARTVFIDRIRRRPAADGRSSQYPVMMKICARDCVGGRCDRLPAFGRNVVHLEAGAVGIFEDHRIVAGPERTGLGGENNLGADLFEHRVARIHFVAAARAERQVMQSRAPLRKSIARRRRVAHHEHVLVREPSDAERRLEVTAHPDVRHQAIVKFQARIVIADRQRDMTKSCELHLFRVPAALNRVDRDLCA